MKQKLWNIVNTRPRPQITPLFHNVIVLFAEARIVTSLKNSCWDYKMSIAIATWITKEISQKSLLRVAASVLFQSFYIFFGINSCAQALGYIV